MKLIERYIFVETLKPCLVVFSILAGLFAAFSSARLLASGLSESLGLIGMVLQIGLKTLIALEVLIPITLYVGAIIGLGRLYKDQEITAMTASGMGRWRIIKAVLVLAVPLALISGLLSVFARPWAYTQTYLMDLQAEADLNTDRFQAGRFYGNDKSGSVIYLEQKLTSNGEMGNVLYFVKKNNQHHLVKAKRAYRHVQDQNQPQLELVDGRVYQLGEAGEGASVAQFDTLAYAPDNQVSFGCKRKAASTWTLAESDQSRELAELQWRLSRPLAALVLALLAIPLSEIGPRQGGNGGKSLLAALIFAIYYNLTGLARTLVEQEKIAEIPGLWWVYGLMLMIAFGLLFPNFWQRRSKRA